MFSVSLLHLEEVYDPHCYSFNVGESVKEVKVILLLLLSKYHKSPKFLLLITLFEGHYGPYRFESHRVSVTTVCNSCGNYYLQLPLPQIYW